MIVRTRPNMLQLFFVVRGSIIHRIFPQVLVVFVLSSVIVWAHLTHPGLVRGFSGAPFAVLGIALSVFLGFRNNACYDRWWEARKIWGQLIYSARGFARQTLILPAMQGEAGREARDFLVHTTIAVAQAMVCFLRPGGDLFKVLPHLPESLHAEFQAAGNRPDMLLRLIAKRLVDLRASGMITDIQYQMLDRTVEDMGIAHASCERIRSTPVPFGYTLLLHRTAHLFCLFMPFGFVDVLGWGTPFSTALVAYTFFGLDALGDELEEPFGNSPNDLPIGALADILEINLREALGETDLPALPQAKGYILM